jgi:hypothetical protein
MSGEALATCLILVVSPVLDSAENMAKTYQVFAVWCLFGF